MLVGNKNDLGHKRVGDHLGEAQRGRADLPQITSEEGKQRAREMNVMFIETSAKTGHNVKQLFIRVASALPFLSTVSDQSQGEMVEIVLEKPSEPEADRGDGGSCSC
ncbi:ras-related protein Rab-41 isoform X2 [Petaurus breviceps papuanus]|uniref:ras-related protein Rab-41 isoform X2 n=1 Tax=Petaurus breviceps papuanus TaxID=3040969 RepID=UPI0036DE59E9